MTRSAVGSRCFQKVASRVGSGQELFAISRVGSGVGSGRVGSGRIGSDRVGLADLQILRVGSGRVGSGRVAGRVGLAVFQISRIGSGWVRSRADRVSKFSNITGRIGSGHPGLIRPAKSDPTCIWKTRVNTLCQCPRWRGGKNNPPNWGVRSFLRVPAAQRDCFLCRH